MVLEIWPVVYLEAGEVIKLEADIMMLIWSKTFRNALKIANSYKQNCMWSLQISFMFYRFYLSTCPVIYAIQNILSIFIDKILE